MRKGVAHATAAARGGVGRRSREWDHWDTRNTTPSGVVSPIRVGDRIVQMSEMEGFAPDMAADGWLGAGEEASR